VLQREADASREHVAIEEGMTDEEVNGHGNVFEMPVRQTIHAHKSSWTAKPSHASDAEASATSADALARNTVYDSADDSLHVSKPTHRYPALGAGIPNRKGKLND